MTTDFSVRVSRTSIAGEPILPTRWVSICSASSRALIKVQVVPLPLVAVTPMIGQGQ